MKDLKKVKYLILDMDGCIYHPKYLKTLFGQVSARMTKFISIKLGIDKIKAKESAINNKIKKIELIKLVNFSIQTNVLLKLKNLNI